MTTDFLGTTQEFVAPSGHKYSIREQNGDDEDILSNMQDARTMMNFTKFISAIVVDTDLTTNGKLTIEQAESLPLLDRYCILFKSRIHSIGKDVEFEYTWPDGTTYNYTQDLTEMLFEDYSQLPSEEEMNAKPYAIPYYPSVNLKAIEHTLASGKKIMFDVLNGKSESWVATLPDNKRSRNSELLARNIRLHIEDHWEKVESFKLFSFKDMAEIRKIVSQNDPEFTTNTEVENPVTGEKALFPILTTINFFFPSER